ncbi:hypothetical protein OC834_005471 [Tilletia horrida]|nr:hypothetical protein OC834_005471 [Tilletia horrida]
MSSAAAPNLGKRAADAAPGPDGPPRPDVRRRTASPAPSGGVIINNNHIIHQQAAAAEEQALVAARWEMLSRERLLREAAEKKLELADKAIGAITVERDEAVADGRSLQAKLAKVSAELTQTKHERAVLAAQVRDLKKASNGAISQLQEALTQKKK